LGGAIYLGNAWPKPIKLFWKPLQEFLAYDFYIQRLYQLTIVNLVNSSARLTAWFDRHVVDGAVNAVGLVTMFSGQALRYTASGQSQLYVLLVVSSLIAIGFLVSWSF